MKTKIFLLFLLPVFAHTQNSLLHKRCVYSPSNELYIELQYKLDSSYFVSDILCSPHLLYEFINNNEMLILYCYPRGTRFHTGDERVIWPILVREVFTDDNLTVRIDLNFLKEKIKDVKEIEVYICDYLFDVSKQQTSSLIDYGDIYELQSIISNRIYLRKNDNGYWDEVVVVNKDEMRWSRNDSSYLFCVV